MDVKTVGVVGTGVIGASWTAFYLARGFDVRATDPADGAEGRLRELVASYWPTLEKLGLSSTASQKRLTFSKNVTEVLSGVVLGHPFSPPHIIPLVEVLGGKLTSPDAVARTIAFYASIGKKPIHIHREIKGHITNRLQAALWQEALWLVEQGIASVADIDTAISYGPGLRWGLLGPFLNLEIAGGSGGLAHVLEHLGPPMESWWTDLKPVHLTPELNKKAVTETKEYLQPYSFDETVNQRDEILIKLIRMKAAAEQIP